MVHGTRIISEEMNLDREIVRKIFTEDWLVGDVEIT